MQQQDDDSLGLIHRYTERQVQSLKHSLIITIQVLSSLFTGIYEILISNTRMVDVMYGTGKDSCHRLQWSEHLLQCR